MGASYLGILKHSYRERLRADGVPLDPSARTPDQQVTADMTLWALSAAAQLEVSGLTTASLDKD